MEHYDLDIRTVPRTPRRRSTTAESYTALTSGFVSSSTAEVNSGHTHDNLGLLNKLATDADNYLYLLQPRERTENGVTTITIAREKIQAGYADRAEEAQWAATAQQAETAQTAEKAAEAERAKMADDLAADSPANQRFLSRKKEDTAEGHITFEQGLTAAEAAEFREGLTSKGDANFEKDTRFCGKLKLGNDGVYHLDHEGKARLRSLSIDEFLEVPELRYNRTTVHIGYQLQSPAAGIIKSVERFNAVSGKVYLKLEEGELGTIARGDLLTGIFHATAQQGGAVKDEDNGKLDLKFAGFATAYFRVEAVDEKLQWFTYTLRPNTTFHPQPFMTFASRGNDLDTERQSFAIYTRTYIRYLKNVNTWEIAAKNIAMQQGGLDNLKDLGIRGVSGVGMFAENGFFSGQILTSKGFMPVEEALEDVREDNRVYIEYSPDGINDWHEDYREGDLYMRQRVGADSAWGRPFRFVGKDAEQFDIETIKGSTLYRAGQGFVGTFRAVYRVGGRDITDTLHPSQIKWTRESEGGGDEHWNMLHDNVFNPITITTDDIAGKTTLIATLYEANGLTNKSSSIQI